MILRSIGAVLAGMVAGVVLTLGVDFLMTRLGVFPPLGTPATSGPLAVATAYRVVFGILGAWITARLAPNRPMLHALVGGAIGFAVGVVGIVVTWNQNLGPHWYPIAVAVIALPCAWAGARLYERRDV